MDGGFLYDDGRVALDTGGVTLRGYYFPFGQSKRIPYQSIRQVQTLPLTWLTGKGRIWGTANPQYWLPLDWSRFRKTTLVVLDVGAPVKPAFTPDDPDTVRTLIEQQRAA